MPPAKEQGRNQAINKIGQYSVKFKATRRGVYQERFGFSHPVHANLALQCVANMGNLEMAEAFGATFPTLVSLSTMDQGRVDFAHYPPTQRPTPGVVTASVSLIDALVKKTRGVQGCIPLAVSRLSRIVNASYTDLQDYTYYFVPAPWLCMNCCDFYRTTRLPRSLAPEPAKSKSATSNARHAVLFEAISLILHMDRLGALPEPHLLIRACSQLGHFLQHRETNLRYMALKGSVFLATSDSSHEAVKKHQETVVAALKMERDVSVRQKAVDLLYAMCDRTNAQLIVGEMLNYLETADYAILPLIRVAGDHVSEEVWYRVVQIVANRDDVQGYAAKVCFQALQAPACHENMVKVAGYVLGEFGNLVAGDQRSAPASHFRLLHSKYHLLFYGNKSTFQLQCHSYCVLPGDQATKLFVQAKPVEKVIDAGSQIQQIVVDVLHDRMTETRYLTPVTTFELPASTHSWEEVDILQHGREALERVSTELGLSFDNWDLDFYTDLFKNKLKRNPTTVECFDLAQSNSGATTGTGGRIRDVHAAGRGAHEIAATAGYCFGNLHIPGYDLPWEEPQEYPNNFAPPLEVAVEASNGASDYGNKFGEPVLSGFSRSFGMVLPGGERREWIKPIMFSGGIGSIDSDQITKDKPEKGMLVVKIGGPVYRIGVGGGAASSVTVQGDQEAELDFGAVQRGDAEMEQKLHRLVRACVERGAAKNPIRSIHDQGAGGNGNVLKEIVEPAGAVIWTKNFQLGDPTITTMELWGAEYQESDAILRPEDKEYFCASQRESVAPFALLAKDPVDLDLESVLGDMPRKVDRCVTGLVAQQQCVGPLHTPLADVAVVSLSYFDKVGSATAIGEQPVKGLLSAAAGARMSVAESVTNLMFAQVTSLQDVKCSGNWMWAAKLPGEGAALHEACQAMCSSMAALGIAVDGGKDSLSMAARVGKDTVKAPDPMMRVAVLREEGVNSDREMAASFYMAGFEAWDVTMTDLLEGAVTLNGFRGLVFPGGFSYADVLGSARGWAASLMFHQKLAAQLAAFKSNPLTFSLGICNGCQLMALLGWVAPYISSSGSVEPGTQLLHNKSGRFECRFSTVKIESSPALMLKGMEGSVLGVWVAHGEGRFEFRQDALLEQVETQQLVGMRYVDDAGHATEEYPLNPNGSPRGIAALCSDDGRHLAIMPHPERCSLPWQWAYVPQQWQGGQGFRTSPWAKLFANAYDWCIKTKAH
ncbi:hypothetical protein HPB52_024212 [Rhipicephalus sanguineus]|uniref:Phosphoribosylformylglycinamidine synthase n=1 Tax=Rhipicephalus sanguineus TaxID=34632 RepID=A0A9D4TCQ0_RHISA|nr:hypothetical protein HPB52_024212 [Rhipicephalus sanguineus]